MKKKKKKHLKVANCERDIEKYDNLFDCCTRLEVITSLLYHFHSLPLRFRTFTIEDDDYFYFLHSCLVKEVEYLGSHL